MLKIPMTDESDAVAGSFAIPRRPVPTFLRTKMHCKMYPLLCFVHVFSMDWTTVIYSFEQEKNHAVLSMIIFFSACTALITYLDVRSRGDLTLNQSSVLCSNIDDQSPLVRFRCGHDARNKIGTRLINSKNAPFKGLLKKMGNKLSCSCGPLKIKGYRFDANAEPWAQHPQQANNSQLPSRGGSRRAEGQLLRWGSLFLFLKRLQYPWLGKDLTRSITITVF